MLLNNSHVTQQVMCYITLAYFVSDMFRSWLTIFWLKVRCKNTSFFTTGVDNQSPHPIINSAVIPTYLRMLHFGLRTWSSQNPQQFSAFGTTGCGRGPWLMGPVHHGVSEDRVYIPGTTHSMYQIIKSCWNISVINWLFSKNTVLYVAAGYPWSSILIPSAVTRLLECPKKSPQDTGGFFSALNFPGCEADSQSLTSAEVKVREVTHFLPHMLSCIGL